MNPGHYLLATLLILVLAAVVAVAKDEIREIRHNRAVDRRLRDVARRQE